MRKAVPVVVAILLVAGLAGCGLPRLWPWRKSQPPGLPEAPAPAEKGAMGLPKPLEQRFTKESIEELTSEISRTRNGLRLVISTDKTEYTMDEPIVLDMRLENRSGMSSEENDKARDISVYFEPFAKAPGGKPAEWLFKFHVRSEDNERTVYRSRDFTVSDDDRAGYYHFMNLQQHAYVGRRFVFPPGNARNWLAPGRYSFLVSYEVSDEFPYVIINRRLTAKQVQLLGSKLAYTRVWTGKLYSNRATVRIRRKRSSWWPF